MRASARRFDPHGIEGASHNRALCALPRPAPDREATCGSREGGRRRRRLGVGGPGLCAQCPSYGEPRGSTPRPPDEGLGLLHPVPSAPRRANPPARRGRRAPGGEPGGAGRGDSARSADAPGANQVPGDRSRAPGRRRVGPALRRARGGSGGGVTHTARHDADRTRGVERPARPGARRPMADPPRGAGGEHAGVGRRGCVSAGAPASPRRPGDRRGGTRAECRRAVFPPAAERRAGASSRRAGVAVTSSPTPWRPASTRPSRCPSPPSSPSLPTSPSVGRRRPRPRCARSAVAPLSTSTRSAPSSSSTPLRSALPSGPSLHPPSAWTHSGLRLSPMRARATHNRIYRHGQGGLSWRVRLSWRCACASRRAKRASTNGRSMTIAAPHQALGHALQHDAVHHHHPSIHQSPSSSSIYLSIIIIIIITIDIYQSIHTHTQGSGTLQSKSSLYCVP